MIISLATGNLCGLLYFLGMHPKVQAFMDTHLPHLPAVQLLGDNVDFPLTGILHLIASFLGVVVSPIALCLAARRSTVLFSVISLTFYYAWRLTEECVNGGYSYFWQSFLIFSILEIVYLVIFAMPTYLYRRSHDKKWQPPLPSAPYVDSWPPPPKIDPDNFL